MKKLTALALTIILCLALCACGNTNEAIITETTTTNYSVFDTTDFVGTWECNYISDIENGFGLHIGDNITAIIELYEAGIGRITSTNTTTDRDLDNYSATWELKDQYVYIRFTAAVEVTRVYKINTNDLGYTLTQVDEPDRIYNKKQ